MPAPRPAASPTGAGSHAISAVYSGDPDFLPSTSATLAQTVNRDPTTTTLASSANPSLSGQAVTYTASVTANVPGSGTPTGTVTFQDGGSNIAGCGAQALSGAGTATCGLTYPGVGSHSITAIYSGDPDFLASSSAALTQTVNQASTTTNLGSSANPSVSGQPVTYTASVTANAPGSGTPTGTVTFQDGGVNIAGCVNQALVAGSAGCPANYPGPASHTIGAAYSGDPDFLPSSSATLTQTVNSDPTTTTLGSSANPSAAGQPVTYTATVTANAPGSGTPTGTVDFRDAGVAIAGCAAQPVSVAGTATCAFTYAGPGSHTVDAVYSGDVNFNASTSAALTQAVNQDSTTTTLGSSAGPSVSGQVVTYTATVTADPPGSGTPTGTVDFRDAGVTIAGCGAQAVSVAGTATCTVTYAGPGSHTISGVYSGDGNFNPSTSPNLTQTVNKGSTTTAVTSSANPSVSGQNVTYTATVTADPPGSGTPTGTVTFQDGGIDIAGCINQPLVAGTASCTTTVAAPGAHPIRGNYSGDARFLTSLSAPVAELILPALPDTSSPHSSAGTAGPGSPDGLPGLWLALLALIAGIGWFAMAALGRVDNGARLRKGRGRVAFVALTVLLCLALGTLAASQVMPAAPPASPSAAAGGSETTAQALPTGTQLIGSKVVSVAKPAPLAAGNFHQATGPILPTRLRIPAIGVDTQVVGVGLLRDGSMDVPDNLWTSAWLSTGARPGQPGTSVIAGHRGIGTPAVFSHLEGVRAGDRIYLSDAAGAELVYEVTRVDTRDLSTATGVAVFGPSAQKQLALITCFGKYSSRTGTYDHRLVVFSKLLPGS